MSSQTERMGRLPPSRANLRPKARLLRTLGTDLISSDKVALIELVKNSYDADANVVVVRFVGPLDEGRGRIEVWDDGHGMDEATLQTSWLDIATDNKRRRPRTERGRRVLGDKGIGRLAAGRLGSQMLLVTRMSSRDEVSLLIDWTAFDREDAYLDEVEVAWDAGRASFFSSTGASSAIFAAVQQGDYWSKGHGTLVQIEKLSRAWGRGDMLELRTALTRLIRPRPTSIPQHETAPEFQVFLDLVDVTDELTGLTGPIEAPSALRTPHYQLSGSVNSLGLATLHYAQSDLSIAEDIEPINLWTDKKRLPAAGPFDIEVNVWDRDKDAIERTLRVSEPAGTAPNARELKGFRDNLDEVAGISIYRDGFRVLPFGERGDDWLGLDLRRVQAPTRRVSNNQIVGHVFISADSNELLKDQSNREGILAGEAYEDLQVLVRAALTVLEARRYTARHPKSTAVIKKGGLFEPFNLDEFRAAVARRYPCDNALMALVDDKNREIQDGVSDVQKVLSRYSRLATLGSLIDRVLHDGRTAVAGIKNAARFGTRDLAKRELTEYQRIERGLQALDRVTTNAELLTNLFNQIEPFGGRRRGRPRVLLGGDILEKVSSILREEAQSRGVQLAFGAADISVKIDEAELLTVLVNLIQNAIYWTSEKPEAEPRQVLLAARRNSDSSVTFVVSDSGPGVPDAYRDHIFDPYFSTKPEGVGLGLSIAGSIVEDIYEGELTLVEEGPLSGATFEATFRRRVQ